MPTLTVRNVPEALVQELKSIAQRHRRSMEEEVRQILEAHVAERQSVLRQVEESWSRQSRRPTAAEVDSWIATGR
jgi:plasmid stability protein